MSSFATPAGAPPTNTLHGARAVFSLGGVRAGYAQNVAYSSSYQLSPIQTLSSIEVVAFVPTSYTCTLTCNNFRLVGTTLRSLGLWPKLGVNPQDHLRNLANIAEITAHIEDIQTNTIIMLAEGVRVESESVSVSAGNLVASDVSLVCRRLKSEDELL